MPRVRQHDLSAEEWAEIDEKNAERQDREYTIRLYYWMFPGRPDLAEKHLRAYGLLP